MANELAGGQNQAILCIYVARFVEDAMYNNSNIQQYCDACI